MYSFIGSIIALVLGYLIYGKFVEGVFGIDSSKATPAERLADGVDYMEMSWYWTNIWSSCWSIMGTSCIYLDSIWLYLCRFSS